MLHVVDSLPATTENSKQIEATHSARTGKILSFSTSNQRRRAKKNELLRFFKLISVTGTAGIAAVANLIIFLLEAVKVPVLHAIFPVLIYNGGKTIHHLLTTSAET
jgi:hypothetical protein